MCNVTFHYQAALHSNVCVSRSVTLSLNTEALLALLSHLGGSVKWKIMFIYDVFQTEQRVEFPEESGLVSRSYTLEGHRFLLRVFSLFDHNLREDTRQKKPFLRCESLLSYMSAVILSHIQQ